MSTWLTLLKRLGEAVFELVGAELAALGDDLRGSSRGLARSLLLGVIASALALLSAMVLTLALIWALGQLFAPWLAALLVGALYALAAAVAGLAARRRLRQLEAPTETVRRHWEEQSRWFQERVLEQPSSEEETDA